MSQDVLEKIAHLKANGECFFVPFIKLVGYGRTQTYQCLCSRCGALYFNLSRLKMVEDMFCSYCTPVENLLNIENLSPSNFVGTIVGWEVKTACQERRRSFYNYKKVYKRDKYQCQYCNYSLKISSEFRPLHIDHIKPWSGGGSNRMDNLVVACEKCNQHASNKWFNSFWDKKKYINQFVEEMPFVIIEDDRKIEEKETV